MVIEFARHVMKSTKPNSSEFDPETPYPVIDLMPEQLKVLDKGKTMRLGDYPCHLQNGTHAAAAYGTEVVYERHRHRYEFNNKFRQQLEDAGLVCSGISPEGQLVEVCEIAGHPWMLGSQFHPEFTSRPNRPQPLFREFINAASKVLREGDQPSLPLNG